MVSQFHIGFTNYMGLELSISAKSAVTSVTGEEELFKCIFNNGDILTV
jgi:hypothetical protein